jgi:ElaB/YqjD/DUF883 family membrane-anchored ribosome-binding protein
MMRQSTADGSGMSEWLLASVRQNPEGLLLLAAGAVLLMRRNSSSSERSHAVSPDPYQPSRGYVRATMAMDESEPGIAEQAKEKAGSIASSASEYAGEARRTVGAKSERIVRSAQSTMQRSMKRILREQPLLVAVAGLAAGAAVASAFPASRMEKETLGPIGDQLSDAASRVGEQLQEATSKAGETLKSAAEERGMNTDGLKEVVSDAAGAFSDSMSGKKDQGVESFEPPPFRQPGSDQNRQSKG